MELTTTLKGQTIQNQIREVGINPHYWYPVTWSEDLKPNQVMAVTIWKQAIALYRDHRGFVHALEDACPHKGVELHRGEVSQDHLVCPYHGWEFNGEGQCVKIPYFPEGQKLPCAQAHAYPIQEKYGVVWIFPGHPSLAEAVSLPSIPEYDNPQWLMIPITGYFHAHFSICNENAMDVFHGFLHRNLQGWFNPVLTHLSEGDGEVAADYQVSYQGWLSNLLGLNDSSGVTTRTVSLRYRYPHYHTSLDNLSSLHLLRLPVNPELTRSFSMMFLQLRLPQWLLKPIRPVLVKFIRHFLFLRFLEQDVEMMESEQKNYTANPNRRYVEVNPAIIALQRVIVRQFEQGHGSQPTSNEPTTMLPESTRSRN